MPAVTHIFSTILILISFLAISACSDNGDSGSTSVDGRLTNIETPFSVEEGNEGTNTTLTITFVPTVTGSISYSTFNITAAEKSDYARIEGDLNVIEGVEEELDITIYGDKDIEGKELIGLKLTHNGEDLAIYYGQILNDDFPKIDMTSTTVLEGDTGTSLLEFTFSLQSEIVDPYEFLVTSSAVDSSKNDPDKNIFYATPEVDFVPVEQNIEFSKGVSEISIYVEVLSDNVLELDERVELQVLSSIGLYDTVYGVIRTDDTIDGDGFDLEARSSKAKEGDSEDESNITWNEVIYTITVSSDGNANANNLVQDQNIQIRLEGKEGDVAWATIGEDFCANNYGKDRELDPSAVCDEIKDYTLEAGATTIDVSFFVKEDLDVETGNEKIKVYLQNNQGVFFTEFIHTIEEDDFPGISVTYTVGETSKTATFEALLADGGIKITEPSDENLTVTIELNLQKSLDAAFTLSYSVVDDDSTPIISNDYSSDPSSGTKDILEGTTGVALQLTINQDSLYEVTEKISLIIDNIGILPISIIDSDLPGLVLKNENGSTVDEGVIELHEQDEVTTDTLTVDKTYTYRLELADSVKALSAFNLSYVLGDVSNNQIPNNSTCEYLSSDNKYLASTEDFKVYLNGQEAGSDEAGIEFKEGQSSVELAIKIIDDTLVECIEYIPLKFTLAPISEEDTAIIEAPELDVIFSISNKDKTTLQVAGWSTLEGSSDQAVLPETEQAFVLTMGQALVTDLTYTLTGENANSCGIDDIKNTVTDAQLTFNGAEVIKSIGVQIPQDNIVEPDEQCQLMVANYDSNLISVIYPDSLDHAKGIILNDDFLNITITPNAAVTEPAESADAPVSMGSITWDKEVAANVGDIVINLEKVICTDSAVDCAEDTDVGVAVDFTINSTISSPQAVGITALADDVVENTETVQVLISGKSGTDFVESLTESFIGEIKNEDKANLVIIGSNNQNEPVSAMKPYTLTWDKAFDLTDATLPKVTISVLDDCSGNSDLECLEKDADYTLDEDESLVTLINGSTQSLEIDYLALNATDSLVELPEILKLKLTTSSAYINTVSHEDIAAVEGAKTLEWSLQVNSLDRLTVSTDSVLIEIAENCDVVSDPTCANKTVSVLKVEGTVAQNGPNISINVVNQCTVNTNNTNNCAIEASNSSTIDSEHDFVFTSGKGAHVIHTYGQAYDWTNAPIIITTLDDDWVEVAENISLNYTATDESTAYIESASNLPITQAITLTSNDTTDVSISRNAALSSCQFQETTTQFAEADCDAKTSQYDLAITNSIAKEVPTINVALDFSASDATVQFKQNESDTSEFDVAAIIDTTINVPDVNKKLLLAVHNQNTATGSVSSNIKFQYKNNEISEPNEDVKFTLMKGTDNTLYNVSAGSGALAYTETMVNDDSTNFWITGPSVLSDIEEKNTTDGTNTTRIYKLHWDDILSADVNSLSFDFNPVTGSETTATLGTDYTITESSDLIAITNSGTTITFDNANTATPANTAGIEITVEIIKDDLVEVGESISAVMSISDSYTAQLASIGMDNVPVALNIPNDDFVTITLHTIADTNEGNSLAVQAVQPFSYTLDKNIDANVPTIELYMDASTCVDTVFINCAESNDYSFGAVAATQLVTLHTTDIATEKSATDPDTRELIATNLPITYAVDERVEAHETLILEFNKGNDGTANTNEAGRVFIKTLLDGDSTEPAPAGPVNELTLSSQIENDDKLNLYITKIDENCTLTSEESNPCEFEMVWFANAIDDAAINNSISEINAETYGDANGDPVAAYETSELVDLETEANDKEATATAAGYRITGNANRSDDSVSGARSSADTAMTNASSAKTAAGKAQEKAQEELDEANAIIANPSSIYAESTAQLAAQAAQAALDAATIAETAAQEAYDAAGQADYAIDKAQDADQDSRFVAAVAAANNASSAAETLTTKVNEIITIANSAITKAGAALDLIGPTNVAPIVDLDAGEISLSMTLAGTAKNVSTPVSDVDGTEADPQDYEINLEDISGGAVTEQGSNKIILKNTGEAMVDLPRTLTLEVLNDNFMEPDETIDVTLNSIAVDTHELIASFPGASYSSTISANDTATITVSAPQDSGADITSGDEDSLDDEGNPVNTVLAYDVTISNKIAKNAPTITLEVESADTAAVETEDFIIADLPVHTSGSETLSFNSPLNLTIKADNTLELDELVKVGLSVTAGTLDTFNEINYTINNDDVLTINVTGASGAAVDEATSNALTYTLTGANMAVDSTELLVASNYPTIAFTHAISGTATGSGTDFTAPADFNVHTLGTPQNNGTFTTAGLSIVNDEIVEQDETIIFAFSENASTDDVIITVNDADTNAFTYTINNNDFINIDFRCDTGTCDGSLSEAGTINNNNSLQVVVLSDYVSQGLSAAERTVTFNVSGDDAGSAEEGNDKDYQLAPVELLVSASADDDAGSIISVNNDAAIELTENFNIEKAHSSFITTNYAQTAFTIKSDDVFTVTPLLTQVTGSTTDQVYSVELCKEENDDIEGGDIILTTTVQQAKDDMDVVIESVSSLSCADIQLAAGINCAPLDSGDSIEISSTLTAGSIPQCGSTLSTTLFTLNGHTSIKSNEWFNVGITSDERCDSQTCAAATDVVVLNNQLSNVLDTGLTQCLESGLDKRWAIDCASVSTGYEKQDAVQTDGTVSINQYPDLAYTFVNDAGQPVAERPDSGEVCVQDNNTGFIWSGTILEAGENSRSYDVLTDIGERTDYDCNIADDAGASLSWQLPSVQDLMSIMDIENLKKARDLGVRFTDIDTQSDVAEGDVIFYESGRVQVHSASYWTSTACAHNKYFTVNFLNGELSCSGTTGSDKHSIMMLYK